LQNPERRGDLRAAVLMVFVFIFLSSISTHTQIGDLKNYELRGVWLNPYAFDDANREETLRKITAANLNTIFAASPYINGNYGETDPKDYYELIRSARSLGLSVHGWICNHRRLGRGNGIDFTNPQEQKAQVKWALDLLDKYPELDGVHFDYIRYKEWSRCDAAKISGINATIRQVYEAIKSKYPDKFLTATSFVAASASYNGRRSNGRLLWEGEVPQWFRDWHSTNPNNWYSMRHVRYSRLKKEWLLGPSHFNYQQDPVTWIKEGILDGVMPMQYSSNRRTWHSEVDLWKCFMNGNLERVYIGLGWLVEKGHTDWRYDPAALIRHIKYGRSQGLRGFVIYQFGFNQLPKNVDDWDIVNALSIDSWINGNDAPFKYPALSPLSCEHSKLVVRENQ
jgi:hypothetical protein